MSGTEGDGQPPAEGKASFEARLRAARERHGVSAPDSAPRRGVENPAGPSPMGVGLRVGVEMVSALAVAVAIGWYLDSWLHTRPAFLIVFVLLGGAAGVANVWRLIGPPRSPR